jgi:hypothetical protein
MERFGAQKFGPGAPRPFVSRLMAGGGPWEGQSSRRFLVKFCTAAQRERMFKIAHSLKFNEVLKFNLGLF